MIPPAFIGGIGFAELIIILGILGVMGGGVLVLVFLAARAGARAGNREE